MLYLPLRFRQDPVIRVEVTARVTGHNSTQCICWGCGKLRTLQITKFLVPYFDLLNLLMRFHTEITPISYLQCDYEGFQLGRKEL